MPGWTVAGFESGTRSLLPGETGFVTAAGNLAVSGGNAILLDLTNAAAGTTTIDNSGSISSPSASPIAIVGTSLTAHNVQIFNRPGASLGGYGPSVFTMGANLGGGTFALNNAGTINGAIILGSERDVIVSTGAINGAINTAGGNDSITIGGLAITGLVDGGSGTDSLTADFTSAGSHQDFYDRIISSSGGSFGGFFASNFAGTTAWFRFQNIEQLNLTFGADNDLVAVDGTALASGATLVLDGGLGSNMLTANFSALTSTAFQLGAGGAIASNRGTFARFQGFDFTLGGGTNTIATGALVDTMHASSGTSSISTAAGNDVIVSSGSAVVTIDGGADYDNWEADYSAATAALSFSFDGVAASLSNGSSASNLESVLLKTGSGNDSVSTAGGALSWHAGSGSDSLFVNYAARDSSTSNTQHSIGVLYAMHGVFYADGGSVGALDVENIAAVLGTGDDTVTLNGRYLAGGGTLSLDGGAGFDTLNIIGFASGFTMTPGTSTGFTISAVAPGAGDAGTFAIDGIERIAFTSISVSLDLFEGTGGDDNLFGTAGTDLLAGFDGNDILSGGDGSDILYGGAGSDILDGGIGSDILRGGTGDDTYIVSDADQLFEGLDEGFDTVSASISWTLGDNFEALKLVGSANLQGTGNALDNVMRGNAGDNVLFGHGGADKLRGADGNDQLYGEDGDDLLVGGAGNDALFGGAGSDRITGGGGVDTVWFDSIGGPGVFDTVTDFVHGTDLIALAATVFTGFSGASVSANEFKLGTAATTANHRLIYDQTTGSLWYDEDGVGGVDQALIAQFSNLAALSRTDFFLG